MKLKRNIILLFLSFVSIGASALNASKCADSAALYYMKSDYKNAIRCYESLLKSGQTSWKLHYNLANSYYKNNQLGYAIFHYELANKLDVGNEDVKTNLKIANSKLIDKIETKENFFFSNVKGSLIGFFSIDGWAWFGILISVLMCVSFLTFYLSKKPIIRKTTFWFGSILFISIIISQIMGYSALNFEKKESCAIVLEKTGKVHTSPGENNPTTFSLHEGTKVIVLEKTSEWISIQLSNGNEGWMKRSQLGLF